MKRLFAVTIVSGLIIAGLLAARPALALIPPPGPGSGSIGLEGTISTAPPARGATIATPGSGAVFTTMPITVAGLCPSGTLVKIFANNVFVGSTLCVGGSYSLQVDLFSGQNDLVARVYDALDQAGPDSNTVAVTFNDAQFAQFGTQLSLTSSYAERGAPPGQQLDWPIIVSGGTGPYAISVDWGDGTSPSLVSQAAPGTVMLQHIYKNAGVYQVLIKATDKNGETAFLQVVGQATGAVQANSKNGSGNTTVRTEVIWWPALLMIPLILAAFWVGRRHELYTLRRQLEKTRDQS